MVRLQPSNKKDRSVHAQRDRLGVPPFGSCLLILTGTIPSPVVNKAVSRKKKKDKQGRGQS